MKVPLAKPIITKEMSDAAVDCLENDRLVSGRAVSEFERDFSKYIGTKYAVAVNSGTAALFLSLKALNVGIGDYVITQSATFIATANSIVQTGAKPIFVDIEKTDNCIQVSQVKQALKDKGPLIKAIIPVHLYGRTGDISELVEVSDDYNVPIIEDACQAHGASFKYKKAGNLGRAAAFSFYSGKNMTVGGDGGMITTNNQEIMEKISILRNQGSSPANKYNHIYIGYNFRLNSVNAAIGRIQLKHLDTWNFRRREISKKYLEKFSLLSKLISPPADTSTIKSAWHIYSIQVKERQSFIDYMKERGIETGIHYPIPVHKQKPYTNKKKIIPYSMENTENWAKINTSLPIYGTMSDNEIDYVIESIKKYFGK